MGISGTDFYAFLSPSVIIKRSERSCGDIGSDDKNVTDDKQLQCFHTVVWATGRAAGVQKPAPVFSRVSVLVQPAKPGMTLEYATVERKTENST